MASGMEAGSRICLKVGITTPRSRHRFAVRWMTSLMDFTIRDMFVLLNTQPLCAPDDGFRAWRQDPSRWRNISALMTKACRPPVIRGDAVLTKTSLRLRPRRSSRSVISAGSSVERFLVVRSILARSHSQFMNLALLVGTFSNDFRPLSDAFRRPRALLHDVERRPGLGIDDARLKRILHVVHGLKATASWRSLAISSTSGMRLQSRMARHVHAASSGR